MNYSIYTMYINIDMTNAEGFQVVPILERYAFANSLNMDQAALQ